MRRVWMILLLSSVSYSAWAIPSPDLVIGLSASVAQVLGLASVLFTGLAFSNKNGTRLAIEKRSGRSKAWRWFLRSFVALLFISITVNILQHTSSIDDQNRRLQTNLVRSSTEAGKSVGDTSLKTLKLSDQVELDYGIENTELAKWLEEGQPINLIDVREPEEIRMGRIPGSWHRRYPDLKNSYEEIAKPGAKMVLMCYSGNRSSELCTEFKNEGKDCSFVVGGYEKWLADGYSLEFTQNNQGEGLRGLPEYPNKEVLLDTPEVVEMFANEDALFVDVRYEEDFAINHLPGAVNLPIRKLTSDKLQEALTNLPHRPVIAPCYDKRSCFYGKILGSRLTQLGYDYRGRYTVPHEFHLPKRGEVVEDFTVLDLISSPLTYILNGLTGWSGSFVAAILILVLILRLLTLPLTWKSERDRLVQKAIAPEIAKLKQKICDDPPRLSKATVQVYRRERLTPVRNLVGSITQLVLFLIFFSVVNSSADRWQADFLWVSAGDALDPFYFMPTLVALLFFGYMYYTSSKRSPLFLTLFVAGGLAIWALTLQLNIAVNLYLVANLSLLFLQSIVFRYLHDRSQAPKVSSDSAKSTAAVKDEGIVPLENAAELPGTGQKAARLSHMIKAGLPVPDGFVVTSKILNRDPDSADESELTLSRNEQALLDKQWKRLHTDKVAVRSSGLNEDGSSQSYAGVFESILDVQREAMHDALNAVRSSMVSLRSSAYSGGVEEKGGALVQKMVDAQYAGVLFTEHPGTTGCSMIEMVSGLGESLVSGKVTPECYAFGRVTGRVFDKKKAPIDLQPLLELGRRVEQLFGRPQDIEWAYVNDQFVLLQARDITSSIRDMADEQGAFERERARLLQLTAQGADENAIILEQNELSELLPRPTPLSASLMESLWAAGGSTDIACRSIGIPYDVEEGALPYVNTVFGALYINRHEERARLRRPPGPMAAFWLARNGESIEANFREGFLPRFINEIRLQDALDFKRLSTERLLKLNRDWIMNFVRETYVQAEVINVATDFYWKTACSKLEGRSIDPARYLGQMPTTVVQRAMSLLRKKTGRKDAIKEFLQIFGHRAPQDYELAQPRYRENPRLVINQLMRAQQSSAAVDAPDELPADPVLRLAVDRARRFQVLKEDAKHHCLRQLALIRKLLLALDERFGLNGGIFFLTLDELLSVEKAKINRELLRSIKSRREERTAWQDINLPSELNIAHLESVSLSGDIEVADDELESDVALSGKRVAGSGDVLGRVHVINSPDEISSFREGEIVVARFTDPTWYPLFPIAGGIVTEVGGWLSHAAIVAREQNLTAIVGVKSATSKLKTGQLVKLCSDGTIEMLEDQRRVDSAMRGHKPVEVPQEEGGSPNQDELESENLKAAAGLSA